MSLKEAKCTNCGSSIKIDPTQDAANCEYCGAAFIVEKAINNYNIANAQINAQTVNVNIGNREFVIEKGVLVEYKGNAKEVVIPDTVMVIKESSFKNCITINSIVIPDNVMNIGYEAFCNCTNLESINIPHNVDELSNNVFAGCHKIKNLTITGTILVEHWYHNIKSFNLPNDLNTENKYMATNILCFLRGYDYLSREDCDLHNLSPVYINGIEVIEKLVKTIESGKNGCYIATAVYDSYDAPQVLVFRRFRDDVLKKSATGRLFIKCYYRVSPPLARRLKHMRRLNSAIRRILDKIVILLKEE